MEEVWKDIKGFEGRYQVSNMGRVRSLDHTTLIKRDGYKDCTVFFRGKILTPMLNSGYYRVSMSPGNGKKRPYLVHRLVAEAFIPNPNHLPMINHKDEVRTNNIVENLELCDALYNNNYGTRNERLFESVCKPRMRAVLQYDKDGNLIQRFQSLSEACRVTGIAVQYIHSACHNRERRHGTKGYIFRFADNGSNKKTQKYNNLEHWQKHNIARRKKVCQYDLNGNFICEYESISDASKTTGIHFMNISRNCSGELRKTHGFIFKFK
jgi:hypothetical protein